MRHIDLPRWLNARIIEDATETGTQREPNEIKLEPRFVPNLNSLFGKRVEL